jgi:hypothetical protein
MRKSFKNLFLLPLSLLALTTIATSSFAAAPKPPTLAITAPKTDSRWSNDVYTVTGTVTKGTYPASNVLVSVNSGAWTPATVSGKDWDALISLALGTNTISAYALDTNNLPSKTNTVKLTYVLGAQLTLNIVGEGKVSPDYSNAFLVVGDHYTMKATADSGFGFFFWNVGDTMTNAATVSFTMESNLVITANFKDTEAPTLTITTPKSGAKCTNTVEVTGTAKDNVGVTYVQVQANGGDWVPASGTSNWTVTLPVVTGNNTIDAAAMDAAGNFSKTNEVKFLGVAPAQAYWAPFYLTNAVITLSPFNGGQASLSFGASTFNYGPSTNSQTEAGVGQPYDYQFQPTIVSNYSMVQIFYLNPPSVYGNEPIINFTFTNFNTGIYTNELNNEAGSFSIATSVASLLPSSWSGQTVTLDQTSKVTYKFKSDSAFSISVNGITLSGTYVVSQVSPVGAFFIGQVTEGSAALTVYLQLTYTSKGNGIYVEDVYEAGSQVSSHVGDFTQ